MDKNLAAQLIKKLHNLDGPLGEVLDLTEQLPDEEERRRFRGSVGDLIARVYTQLMVPVLRQYPDLDPDQDFVFDENDPLKWDPRIRSERGSESEPA